MTFRKLIPLLISLTMIAALVACSSNTNYTPPPPGTGPLADGNYVFSLGGQNANGNYYVAGAFTVTGGAITGGEQDFVDAGFNYGVDDAITASGSSIVASGDGNLIIVLGTADPAVGVGGTETLNGTILPNSTTDRTLITEYDGAATSSGELDPQDTTGAAAATPSAGYAFVLNGVDFDDDPLVVGGVVNVDGPGTISGAGSIFDANDSGLLFPGETFANTSTVSAPDAFGRVLFTLDATDTTDFPEVILVGYIVDSTHVRLVETADSFAGATGGTALSQGVTNTGLFTAASAQNTYVLSLNGADINGALQAVGQIAPGTTTVAGWVDFNDLVNSSAISATSPDAVSAASYSMDTAGIAGAGAGDVTISNLNDGFGNSFNLQVYLDGNGNALAITMDNNDAIAGFGFAQPAAAVGAFTAGSLSGNYGLNITGWDPAYTGEFDGVGPNTADGVSAITGTVDLNWLFTGTFPGTAVAGTFTANADGVFTDGLTGVDVTNCFVVGTCTNDLFNYYLTGDAAGDTFTIETDVNQLTLGYFSQQ